MLFNSYIFIFLFLPLCVCLYFGLHHFGFHKLAKIELFGMSLWFYGYFNPSYILIICASILINFGISKWIIANRKKANEKSDALCKLLMACGVIANVALLFYFKYFDFFLSNMNALFHADFEMRNIVLPLGISFFTFQQISYVVDSYRGETTNYSLLDYAVFVAFFPQLVAGPIVLHNELIPQFCDESKYKPNADFLARGLWLFAMGLGKKVIIADALGNIVALGFGGIDILTTFDVLLMILCYALQLYFDFSGYCDMASGIASMFNIKLPMNFNSPYKSFSILEFWDRWHMTLTRFLRSYIYFPLGGSRKGIGRTYLNIMIVFLVSGIWHGANWTFIVWGLLHGIAEVLTRRFRNAWLRIPRILQWIVTFGFVSSAFLIFRADSLSQAYILFRKIIKLEALHFTPSMMHGLDLQEITWIEKLLHVDGFMSAHSGIHVVVFLAIVMYITLFQKNSQEREFKCNIKSMLSTMLLLVWAIVSLSGVSTFLYFNF